MRQNKKKTLCDELLKVDTMPRLLPVAVARRLQSLWAADLARFSVNTSTFISPVSGGFGHHFGPPTGVSAVGLPVGTALLGRDGVLLRLFKCAAQRFRVSCWSRRGLAAARHETFAQFGHESDYEGNHADFQAIAPRPAWPGPLEAPTT